MSISPGKTDKCQANVPNFSRILASAQGPKPKAHTPEPRAHTPEPKAQGPYPRAQGPYPRGQGPEPRAQSPGFRAQHLPNYPSPSVPPHYPTPSPEYFLKPSPSSVPPLPPLSAACNRPALGHAAVGSIGALRSYGCVSY